MPDPDHAARVDHLSPFPFELTVERLMRSITDAGMQLFASIDHAANAREAGLSMPASTVLIYGKAAGGTPVMLASPASALDLPLHVLVREGDNGGVIVSFHPIGQVLEAAGVPPALAARLGSAQDLLLKVLQP
jgi:uncharacterized protein (DUF302 family)